MHLVLAGMILENNSTGGVDWWREEVKWTNFSELTFILHILSQGSIRKKCSWRDKKNRVRTRGE